MSKRLVKRHKRQVKRAKEQVRLSEPDLRTPEQIKAAKDAGRPAAAKRQGPVALYTSSSRRLAGATGSAAKADA